MALSDIFRVGKFKTELEEKIKIVCELQQDIERLKSENNEKSKIIQALKTDIENLKKLETEVELGQKTIHNLKIEASNLRERLINLHAEDYESVKANIIQEKRKLQQVLSEIEVAHKRLIDKATDLKLILKETEAQEKTIKSNTNKLERIKNIYDSINYAIQHFQNSSGTLPISTTVQNAAEELIPTVTLNLPHMSMRELRKAFHQNDKQIEDLLKTYSENYTTKANKAIYNLMTIALRAELQNVIYNLKYDKLDKSLDAIQSICNKYLQIASDGNQTISPTLTKFIGQLEYYFINAVKIEYNYYVKKEQARQEQAEIRERMRQEAAERKALAEERKKIEQEEQKFHTQIQLIQEKINIADSESEEMRLLKERLLELQSQLGEVTIQKEKVITLQNGLAGTVYIISNIGAFGENVFKVGMTRRMDPNDRIRELGDASVPFPFDVHSFIFSDKASTLETELHRRLNEKRLNRVNLRKEFFHTTIDELEKIVLDIDPTAEFNRTVLAEQYRQSQSTDTNYEYVSDPDYQEDLET